MMAANDMNGDSTPSAAEVTRHTAGTAANVRRCASSHAAPHQHASAITTDAVNAAALGTVRAGASPA